MTILQNPVNGDMIITGISSAVPYIAANTKLMQNNRRKTDFELWSDTTFIMRVCKCPISVVPLFHQSSLSIFKVIIIWLAKTFQDQLQRVILMQEDIKISFIWGLRFLVNDQRDAQILFYVFISIYNSLHVSNTSCSSSGETNCFNTASGNSHSMLVAELCAGWKKSSSNLQTFRPPT